MLTLVLVLGLSSFAFAADNEAEAVQTGDFNEAHITQDGSLLYSEVLQTGDENFALIEQDGEGSEAIVVSLVTSMRRLSPKTPTILPPAASSSAKGTYLAWCRMAKTTARASSRAVRATSPWSNSPAMGIRRCRPGGRCQRSLR